MFNLIILMFSFWLFLKGTQMGQMETWILRNLNVALITVSNSDLDSALDAASKKDMHFDI